MKWAIVGGSGFIGSNLAAEIKELFPNDFLACVDIQPPMYVSTLWDEVVELDIRDDEDPWCPASDSVVVHLAAESGLAPCAKDPLGTFRTNVVGFANVLERSIRGNARRVLYASSGAVLAGSSDVPPREHSSLAPVDVYGGQKAAAEMLALASRSRIATCSMRFSNVYGLYSAHKRSAVHAFIQSVMRGEPMRIVGSGVQSRDFVWVRDVAQGIIKLANVPDPKFPTVAHLSSGMSTSIADVARLVHDLIGEGDIEYGVEGNAGVEQAYLSNLATKVRLGWRWRPIEDILAEPTGVAEAITWYKERRDRCVQ